MIRRFLRISRSILEEWTAMFSGRFPPYHKMGIAVALITTAAFSYSPYKNKVYSSD